jgi:protein-L-isoaspartate(D-aspartate) O-methyltransferase
MPPPHWRQYQIEFPDRVGAEQIAAHDLLPVLSAAQDARLLHGWWFVRKKPWKLRYLADDPAPTKVTDLLDKLAADGCITGWAPGIYEPEIRAFGGDAAMQAAHTLFHHDSHHLLTRAAQLDAPVLGQCETTVLLCSAMLRAAGLDWYEQGDVWANVAQLRPTDPAATTPERVTHLASAMRRLMTADTRSFCAASGGPLVGCDGWVDAFEHAGQELADLARRGRLTRGLRAVLAHHIIFHTNRAGLPTHDQAILAALASHTVFTTDAHAVSPPIPVLSTTKVPQVTTLRDDPSAVSVEQFRDDLTDRLRDQNVVRTPAIEAAFRRTPRHLFLPGVPAQDAYADNPVYTKRDASGASISAASQPWIVAMMLDQLDARPGERILEVGAGTGYNAALLAALVGDTGHVATIDVDADLVAGARRHLTAAGIDNVEVVHGDGALGHPDGAPYDRIIATVGAFETPTAWLDQLTPTGRLVVPLRLRGTSSRSIVFERGADGGWVSRESRLAVFMPLRGIGDDARRVVALTPEQDVTLQVNKDQPVDAPALAGILDAPRHEEWTDVLFPPNVSYEWLELWLAMRLDHALMRMNVHADAAARGAASPMFPWGSMATTRGTNLAYLTTRPAPPAADGGKLYQVGVIGHGPSGHELARQVAEEVGTWGTRYRDRSVRFEMPDAPATANPGTGRFVLHRPHHPITVIWE